MENSGFEVDRNNFYFAYDSMSEVKEALIGPFDDIMNNSNSLNSLNICKNHIILVV